MHDIYVDEDNRNLEFSMYCSGASTVSLGWKQNGIPINTVGRCNSTNDRQVCPHEVQIRTFRNDYAGLYTCYNSRTGKSSSVIVAGMFSIKILLILQFNFLCNL